MMNLSQQQGVSFVEVIVVVVVLSILASFAAPSFSFTLQKYRLESSQKTLVEFLKEAKRLARTESTTARVILENIDDEPSTLTLNTISGFSREKTLYTGVTFDESRTITFSAIGTITPPDGAGMFRIVLTSSDIDQNRYVDVVASGMTVSHNATFSP